MVSNSDSKMALWFVDLTKEYDLERLYALLSSDEKARADRFHFSTLRRNFIAAHAALRLILADRIGTDPQLLEFDSNEFGKPFLKGRTDIAFNLSHANEWALCAIARGGELGVDIEQCCELQLDDLAEQFFSASEVNALKDLPSGIRRDGFFDCWTRKEAYVKAKGLGLSLPLHAFSVNADPRLPPALLSSQYFPSDVGTFRLWALPAPDGYRATLAYRGDDAGPPQVAHWTVS